MKEYNSKSFKVLNELEKVKLNLGMYIGQSSTPTHLIEEVLDNALDECLAGYANIVIVEYDSNNNMFSVRDNGRGIPIEKDIPITISTILHSGSKFKGHRDAYKICSGRHGVGLAAVNALSDWYKIEIIRKSIYSIFEFKHFNLIKKYSAPINEKKSSTKITFKPDGKIFESLIPDMDRIRNRLLIASIHLKHCAFVLVIDKKEEIIKLNTDEYFTRECLSENEEITEIINVSVTDKKEIEKSSTTIEELNLKLCYSLNGAITPKILGSVNLLPVENGGIHVKLLTGILKDILSSYGKKMNKRFIPQDTLCGLRAYIDLSLAEPEFGGQTKTQLINRKSYLEKLFNKTKKILDEEFSKRSDQLDMILKRFEDYRIKSESKKAKGSTNKSSIKFTKLRDCKIHPKSELFIVEGDSAKGSFIQCRNSQIHAIMPMKGKPPSVAEQKNKIINNQEIKEIISAVGTWVEPDFNISKLRYDKIILCADADPDGGHINSLLLTFFGYMMPEIVKRGILYVCQIPLFAINKGKIFKPIWTKDGLEKARAGSESKYITRFKGIGELSPWQLKICALDEKTRKLIKVEYSKDIDSIMKLLSDSNERRNLLDG